MINNSLEMEALNEQIYKDSAFMDTLNQEIGNVIIGQKYMTDRLLIGLLTGGHVLLEGMPGLAKTLAIKTLASAVDARFSRIQFTPDLMPADITGTEILAESNGQRTLQFTKGPVFANVILDRK
jgi:MoxR-like ATPase